MIMYVRPNLKVLSGITADILVMTRNDNPSASDAQSVAVAGTGSAALNDFTGRKRHARVLLGLDPNAAEAGAYTRSESQLNLSSSVHRKTRLSS